MGSVRLEWAETVEAVLIALRQDAVRLVWSKNGK
jgi:hypothetical protein